MSQLVVGTKVIARTGDEVSEGTVAKVFDEDQGDFEYYIEPDDGGVGSFWPRECLEVRR